MAGNENIHCNVSQNRPMKCAAIFLVGIAALTSSYGQDPAAFRIKGVALGLTEKEFVDSKIPAVIADSRRRGVGIVVHHRWIGIAVANAIVTIPVSVAGIVGRIRIFRIFVGSVWVVAPVPVPPRTPPPWRAEVADKDDFLEMIEATKPMISIKAVVETVKTSKAQG